MPNCEECNAPADKPHASNCSLQSGPPPQSKSQKKRVAAQTEPAEPEMREHYDFSKGKQGAIVKPTQTSDPHPDVVLPTTTAPEPERGPYPTDEYEPSVPTRVTERELVAAAVGLELQGLKIMEFAQAVVKNKLAPACFSTPESVLIAFQIGREAGLSEMQSLSAVVVINNVPSWRGDAAHALIQNSGKLRHGTDAQVTWEGEPGADNRACIVRMYREGVDDPFEGRFSVADAKRAKLWGKAGPWVQYPQRMLYYRALGFCARDGFSDVLRGLAISEEVGDYARVSQVRDVTPPRREPPRVTDPLLASPSSAEGGEAQES